MTISDAANQLLSHANDFVQNAMAASNASASSINSAIATIIRVQELAADSIVVSAGQLGTGHPGMTAIYNSSLSVSNRADVVKNSLEKIIELILEMDASVMQHSTIVTNVANAILNGGS